MPEKKLVDEIPHLMLVGFERKIQLFTEIARHPKGLSVNELIEATGFEKMSIWSNLKPLVRASLINGRKTERNGRRVKVFKVTPFGIDVVQREMKALCMLYSTIRQDIIATKGE